MQLADQAFNGILHPAASFHRLVSGCQAGAPTVDPFVALISSVSAGSNGAEFEATVANQQQQIEALELQLRQAETAQSQRAEKSVAMRKKLSSETKRSAVLEADNGELRVSATATTVNMEAAAAQHQKGAAAAAEQISALQAQLQHAGKLTANATQLEAEERSHLQASELRTEIEALQQQLVAQAAASAGEMAGTRRELEATLADHASAAAATAATEKAAAETAAAAAAAVEAHRSELERAAARVDEAEERASAAVVAAAAGQDSEELVAEAEERSRLQASELRTEIEALQQQLVAQAAASAGEMAGMRRELEATLADHASAAAAAATAATEEAVSAAAEAHRSELERAAARVDEAEGSLGEQQMMLASLASEKEQLQAQLLDRTQQAAEKAAGLEQSRTRHQDEQAKNLAALADAVRQEVEGEGAQQLQRAVSEAKSMAEAAAQARAIADAEEHTAQLAVAEQQRRQAEKAAVAHRKDVMKAEGELAIAKIESEAAAIAAASSAADSQEQRALLSELQAEVQASADQVAEMGATAAIIWFPTMVI